MTDTPKIFISYSHQDEHWKDLVVSHLKVAERQGAFVVWDDRRIGGGDDWRDEIDAALFEANIAILLISRHFLTSNFIMDHEVGALLDRKQQSGLRLYPILISDCTWKSVDWLERLQLKPLDAKALDAFKPHEQEGVVAGMAAEIGYLLEEDEETARHLVEFRAKAEVLGKRLGVTEGAVQSFLTILDERHVDSADLENKLKEIADQYLEMQKRLAVLDREDPKVRRWIEQAKTAIKDGDYDEADKLLTSAEERDLSRARDASKTANRHFLNAAAARALRGDTSLTRLRYHDAAEHFSKAAKMVPETEAKIRAEYLYLQGFALDQDDWTVDAIAAVEEAISYDSSLTRAWILLGRRRLRLGNPHLAKDALFTARHWARQQNDQRAVATAEMFVGDVLKDQRDLEGALRAYQRSRDIFKTLVDSGDRDAGLLQNLSNSHHKIGHVHLDRDNDKGAAEAFHASLYIAKEVDAKTAGRDNSKQNLARRYRNLGVLRLKQGGHGDAIDYFETSRSILEPLVEKNPSSGHLLGDLAVIYNNIGDVRFKMLDFTRALKAYRADLKIAKYLATRDPNNSHWQKDLAESHSEIAAVFEKTHDVTEAREHLKKGLAIATMLQETGRLAEVVAPLIDDLQRRLRALETAAGADG